MKRLTASILCVSLLFLSVNVYACTIFMQRGENKVLVGTNEDFYYSYTSMYWIVRSDDEYSRICFGNSIYVQGGMNEKGLFYDGATCPQSDKPYNESNKTLGMDAGEVVLSKCATVKEAVEFLSGVNIASSYNDHLLFADSSGDAAVVEWLEGEMRVTWIENNRLIATNFFLSNTSLGGYPCDRYDAVESALSEASSPTISNFMTILGATSQTFGGGGTKYSNIYDLKNLTVYVYQKADFSNAAAINLSDELEKQDSGDNVPVNINTLSYIPVLLVFDGINTEDYDSIEEPILTDSSLSDLVDTGIIESDSVEGKNLLIPVLLLVLGVIVAVFFNFLISRRKR